MLYALWDDTNETLIASDENPATVMSAVRSHLAAHGDGAADALVFVLEDDDEGLHYLASGGELVRMAQTGEQTEGKA